MAEVALSPLSRWENFYVIVGSSAGALTGLQFVVMTLIAESRASMAEVRAFGSPTVVHFCAVLLISAIASAPWQNLSHAAIALGTCGIAGFAYAITVVRHARRQTGYKADMEDWLWYIVLPLASYALLVIAAFLLRFHPATALFFVAATSLLLLFIGIHNSWDTVTYIALKRGQKKQESTEHEEKAA
jgi:hypothetical protein